MKKVIVGAIALSLVLSGCSGGGSSEGTQDNIEGKGGRYYG
jgi:hypothetical protein